LVLRKTWIHENLALPAQGPDRCFGFTKNLDDGFARFTGEIPRPVRPHPLPQTGASPFRAGLENLPGLLWTGHGGDLYARLDICFTLYMLCQTYVPKNMGYNVAQKMHMPNPCHIVPHKKINNWHRKCIMHNACHIVPHILVCIPVRIPVLIRI